MPLMHAWISTSAFICIFGESLDRANPRAAFGCAGPICTQTIVCEILVLVGSVVVPGFVVLL